MSENEMNVIKRDGSKEPVSFDKILKRLNVLCKEFTGKVNTTTLVIKAVEQLHDNILTTQIDELCASLCASNAILHPDYNTLAGRIINSNHHKNTSKSFVDVMTKLYEFKDINNKHTPLISEELFKITKKYSNKLDRLCDYSKDNLIDYFGFKTLERSYLMKINKKVVERIQHMWLRVSIGIHGDNYEKFVETYKLMSSKYFTHATPTLYNAGTSKPQLSSCFLLQMESDSIDGIFNTLKECAQISKLAGGIGLHIHNIRATGSHIRGTNGISNGIIPMLRVFNNAAKYVDQGGSKRSGSFAIYIEPWHADIELFLDMKKNHGDEELKARDLFYALWVPDLFMERVKLNEKWTLMCPDECPGLSDVYGDEFVDLYVKYETEKKGKKTVNARDLWYKVLDAQMETGTPYLSYKDSINKKSNQKNIGIIKSSNLCNEITLVSNERETAVCNLASIALPTFVTNEKKFDYEKLHEIVKIVIYNLNKVIDVNYYPNEKARISNMRHRPVGLGVQGLADVFFLLDIPFNSDEAKEINKNIFETMYHAALEKSSEMAVIDGKYETFEGSPASNGILQFDMWNIQPTRYNWAALKEKICRDGLRNSMLIACMPTASTSQVLGFNECIEPITSNIYSRRTNSGEFVIVNKYLVNDLIHLKLWNEKIKDNIIANNGSVQHIDIIPENIRDKYKTVWEMKMKDLIDMSKDRGSYVCQGQSLNLFVMDPNYNTLTSMHFYAFQSGLKTGIYYLRRRAKAQAQKFTIVPELKEIEEEVEDEFVCTSCGA
jgi:ribonucleoside-diphosphate reductase alpha subunit